MLTNARQHFGSYPLAKRFCLRLVATEDHIVKTGFGNCIHTLFPTKGIDLFYPLFVVIKDVQIIKESWEEDQFALLGYLILHSGLRKGEALALTYGDIDKKAKRIHVTKSDIMLEIPPI